VPEVKFDRPGDALLHAIVDTSPDALVAFDAHDRPSFWNDALLDLLDIPAERLTRMTGRDLHRRIAELLENSEPGATVAEPDSEIAMALFRLRDGRMFERVARKYRRAQGEGLVVRFRDVTRLADAAQIEDRDNPRFEQAHPAARIGPWLLDHKMEAIGRLAGGVAHELNNILTAITGQADLLADEIHDHPALQEINDATGSATRLTRQLLAFSRQQHLRPTEVDVSQILLGISGMLERLIGNQIQLDVRVPASLPPVRVDPGQLEQVVVNLVVNARDAMPDGGRIVLSASHLHSVHGDPERAAIPPGDYVAIRVDDKGRGIAPEAISQVFEPFFTTKGAASTGLGLAMVYGIVKQSGGFVSVDSKVGRGSVFSIEFPVTQASLDQTASEPVTDAVKKTILVVDDQDNVRRIVVRFIEDEGHRVLESESPVEALRMVTDPPTSIDLLVTDVAMPVMPGDELSRRLRQHFPTLRTVYMSGFSNEHLEAAPDALFVPKPFNRAALINKVREALSWSAH
jgi:signal transduction histidine kinase